MTFGKQLKKLRTDNNITQLQLSEILGTAKSNISKYESDTIEPNLTVLSQLSRLFHVPVDYLLGTGIFEDWNVLLKNKQSIIEQIATATKRISESMLYGLDDVTFARLAYAFDVHIVLREDGNGISITDPIPTYTDTIFPNEVNSSEDIILSLLRSQTEEEKNDIKNLITSFCSLSAKDKTKVLGKCFDLEDLNRSRIQSSPKTGTDNLGK